jgi:sulfotransferase famil protein
MISHQHQCVFVHIPKTAGQSVERVFLDLLGLDWETRAPLLLRSNDRPDLGPPKLAHLTAGEYVSCGHLSQEQYDSYFKFSVVRDPWDRVVSMYKYLGYGRRVPFKTFVLKILERKLMAGLYWFVRPQSEYLYDEDGILLVDQVGRFETLQDDFDQVARRLGLAQTLLPHTNRGQARGIELAPSVRQLARYVLYQTRGRFLPRFERSRDYYDAASRDCVADLYRKDLDLFGYEFS